MPKPEFWQIPAATAAATERADKLEAALAERLQHIAERFPRAVLASSLAVEDMIITDQICRHALPIRIITLNTGKLNPETEALIAHTDAHYGIAIEVFRPLPEAAAVFEREHGAASIYEHIERRRQCCHIRKIAAEPCTLRCTRLAHRPAPQPGRQPQPSGF